MSCDAAVAALRGVPRSRGRAAAVHFPVLFRHRRSHARPRRRHLHRFARFRVGVHVVWRQPVRRLYVPQFQHGAGRLLALVAPPFRLGERGCQRASVVHDLQPSSLPFQPLHRAVRGRRAAHRGIRCQALPHDPLSARCLRRHVGGHRRIGRRAFRRYARCCARASRHRVG